MSDFTTGAHECFCDRQYKDANKLASCGDCPRDYIAGAWDARRKYIEEHSKMTDRYEEWRNFYAKKVRSWMSLDEIRVECGKLQTVDNPSPEVLLVHAMHALEKLQAEVERLRADRDSWEQQASDRVADWHAEHLRAERLAEALEDIRSRSCMNLAMNPNLYELTALLGDIHQIADAALGKENSND